MPLVAAGLAFLCLAGGFEAVGIGSGVDDVASECQPVHFGRREAGIGKGPAPFTEVRVGGARDGCPFFPGRDDLEEQLRAVGIEFDVDNLVQAQQVQTRLFSDQP